MSCGYIHSKQNPHSISSGNWPLFVATTKRAIGRQLPLSTAWACAIKYNWLYTLRKLASVCVLHTLVTADQLGFHWHTVYKQNKAHEISDQLTFVDIKIKQKPQHTRTRRMCYRATRAAPTTTFNSQEQRLLCMGAEADRLPFSSSLCMRLIRYTFFTLSIVRVFSQRYDFNLCFLCLQIKKQIGRV